MTANHSMRVLHLARIFFEETDETAGLSMPELIARLQDCGITAQRKTLYRDIDALREFGLDIEMLSTRPVEYALVNRPFSLPELTLLVDSVQSSRFLTKGKSDALAKSLRRLASKQQAVRLTKNVHVSGRIKTQNESVYQNVDTIQEAMRAKRKVRFRYFKYDVGKHRRIRREGRFYVETPVQLIYSNECYYLVAYNDKYSGFTNYRVDRMIDIAVSEEPMTRNADIAQFNAEEYANRTFSMYGGTPVNATLVVSEKAMSGLIDRFSKDVRVTPLDEATARAHVSISESPTFFGWLAQFGTAIRIERPQSLAKAYAAYLDEITSLYRQP